MEHVNRTESPATIVRRPSAGDAIGVALRDAYARDRSVPDELQLLLAQLNAACRNPAN